jgi:hypothetical protein
MLETNNFTLEIDKCNFEASLTNCELSKLITSGMEVGFFDEKNLVFNFKWLKYIVEVFVQPILCLFGIFTNLLTIKVIRNRSTFILRKNLNKVMYKHQLACSICNVCLCSIKILSLMNICIFPRTSFCSSINEETATQYFKIYVVNFLGKLFQCIFFDKSIFFNGTRYRPCFLKKSRK